jgi:hypothetical protein
VALPRASWGVGELDLGDERGGGAQQQWLHGSGCQMVGNGGAGPVVGSRWSENWLMSSGVVSEGCRWEELIADGADGATMLWGVLAAYGGSKTGLLLRGDVCARGWWC